MTTNDDLLGAIDALRGEVTSASQKLTIRSWVVGTVIAVLAVMFIVVALAGVQAHLAVNDVAANTKEARLATCLQFNVGQSLAVNAERSEIRKLVGALVDGKTDSATTQRVHDFLKDYDETVITEHPLRDCSPTGIAKYLQGPTTGATTTSTIPLIR